MSRRKRQPEHFDVVEFLRESDGDLKSALNSLLRSPSVAVASADDSPNTGPGINLVPPSTGAAAHDSEINSDPAPVLEVYAGRPANSIAEVNIDPGSILNPGPKLAATGLAFNIPPGPNLTVPDPLPAINRDNTGPGLKLTPPPILASYEQAATTGLPNLRLLPVPIPTYEPKKRQFPIREMKLAQDAHTRAEQQVYEYLWQNAKPRDDVSRTITIGFGSMARVVRLSESNARINVRSLIAKLAIQDFGDYNCERSVGRTYRIFNYSEILKRRREAGLLWYMRRTLAVVFVDPRTGHPLDLGLKKTYRDYPGPGPNISGGGGVKLAPETLPKLTVEPGLNLGPHIREEEREINLRETLSSSDSILFEALSQYGVADDDVLKRLRAETRRACPDFTDEELVHFIHSKGQLIRRRDSGISSPIGFLLTSVPKCFVGEAFQLFRKAQRETREREAAERAQREAELENWSREQQAILDDPNASEEDKKWARKVLYPDETF
jgi:hypothetical protein